MKNATAIRHVYFEDLGSWEKPLKRLYDIRYIEAPSQNISALKNEEIDLLIILGGPVGVYQEQEFPFIKQEIDLLEKRLKLDLPTLGICLGGQMIAKALGANVYPSHIPEVGWQPLILTEAGSESCAKHLASEYTSMFHWHGDTFDLPENALLLASTPNCKNQIFSWGKNVLGFQCHLEVTAERLEYWWVGHAGELIQDKISVNDIRAKSRQFGPKLEVQSLKCLQEWLDKVNLQ